MGFSPKKSVFNKTKKKIVYVSSVCLLSFEEAVLQLHSPWHKIQDGCYLHVKIYHNAYVASVFLYNSELWTLTKKLENAVNTFQRRHLRKILGIHWPKKITNTELYTKTKTEEWSITIQRRRLNWLGHLMRLHPETPARLALAEYLRKVKRPKGRPQRTWMELIKYDLKTIVILDYNKPNKTIEQLTQMAHDRNYWRNIVRRVVLQK